MGEGRLCCDGLSALIPAAGYASRMKAFKPLLPLGSATVIETVISLFRDLKITDIVVVTGHNHGALAPVVERAGGRPVFNPAHDQGMFSSIRAGAAALAPGCRGFFLLPADIPAIRPSTLENLMETFLEDPGTVVVPEFRGTGGHPPLIPAGVIRQILASGPESTLRDLLFTVPGKESVPGEVYPVRPLAVADRGVLMDGDRPEDYAQIRDRAARLDIPDAEECLAVMEREGIGPDLQAHLELVAKTALMLAEAVKPRYPELNADLIRAGALLHDIKRREPDHARAGREFLLSLGFPGVAKIAGDHMDLVWDGRELKDAEHTGRVLTERKLTERELVFLADKLCCGTRIEPDVYGRFLEKARTYPRARERIMARYETARHIQSRIEWAAGRSLGEILG